MRNALLLLLCTCLCTVLFAQSPALKITENTIVKDSNGVVFPYFVWKPLLTQGDYKLRPLDPQNKNTPFLLVKLTEEEKNQSFEKMPKPAESEFFRTGTEFSSFKTKDINNTRINLKEEKGKIIVLNFWFINCPPCRMEIPSLNELVKTFNTNESVKFIGVALDDRFSLQQFLKATPFDYTIVQDGRYLAERYRVRSFPTHVIINQEGKVYFHSTGLAPHTVYWLKKSITELLTQPTTVAQQQK